MPDPPPRDDQPMPTKAQAPIDNDLPF